MSNLRANTLGFLALAALFGATSPAAAQSDSTLEGGWVITSWTSPDGETNAEPQRGLFMFTNTGHYSMLYMSQERSELGENATDADRSAAYNGFTANSGRYRATGGQLTYEAFVAKDPGYMANFGDNAANGISVTYSVNADGILSLKWTGGRAAGRSATLRRGRGTQNPG
jgi:hypothetical protein